MLRFISSGLPGFTRTVKRGREFSSMKPLIPTSHYSDPVIFAREMEVSATPHAD
jgi:hypothetical protein